MFIDMGAGTVSATAQAPMHSPVNWALLGLVIERPSYAYELARRFERTYDGALSLSSVSHVYTALATLRERGLVEESPDARAAPALAAALPADRAGLAEHAEWLVGQVSEERRRQQLLVSQLGALARDPAARDRGARPLRAGVPGRDRGRPAAGRHDTRHHRARRAADRRGDPPERRREAPLGAVRARAAVRDAAASGPTAPGEKPR